MYSINLLYFELTKMYKLRSTLANLSRRTPYFRGKRRAGNLLSYFSTNFNSDYECVEKIKMKDGSLMNLDVRSRTEQWSYWTGYYDNDLIYKLSSCLNDKCIVLDVGANIGFYSVPLGRKVKALNGKLYAFEPVKSNFNRLVSNISLNNLKETILVQEVALGDEEGFVEMSMENNNHAATGNAVMVKQEIPSNYHDYGLNSKALLTKLDTFAEKHGIQDCSLIKIDVEGAEGMFFRGGKSFLSQTRPIIYGEFNNYFMPKYGDTFLDIANIISSWNYRFFKSDRNSFVEIQHLHPKLEHMLLVPSETSDTMLNNLGCIRK